MHIAIEGLDGSGKTSTAKRVAEELGMEFIEKPLHYFMDEYEKLDTYSQVTKCINDEDAALRARFYGVGNYYVSQIATKKDVITDRHLVSNYYWNNNNDDEYFNYLIEDCGKPDITFVLYVSSEERRRRILERNIKDPDLEREVFDNESYKVIEGFLEKYDMKHYIIDTTNLTLEEVVNIIIKEVKKIKSSK